MAFDGPPGAHSMTDAISCRLIFSRWYHWVSYPSAANSWGKSDPRGSKLPHSVRPSGRQSGSRAEPAAIAIRAPAPVAQWVIQDPPREATASARMGNTGRDVEVKETALVASCGTRRPLTRSAKILGNPQEWCRERLGRGQEWAKPGEAHSLRRQKRQYTQQLGDVRGLSRPAQKPIRRPKPSPPGKRG